MKPSPNYAAIAMYLNDNPAEIPKISENIFSIRGNAVSIDTISSIGPVVEFENYGGEDYWFYNINHLIGTTKIIACVSYSEAFRMSIELNLLSEPLINYRTQKDCLFSAIEQADTFLWCAAGVKLKAEREMLIQIWSNRNDQ